jgi:AcrR family transcriptional regulator
MADWQSPESDLEGDARVRRSKEAVLTATYELLTKAGLGGVTIDEVARRSGVAKTTIYRHWPSRSALLLDACSRLSGRPEPPDTGSLEGDLAALAANLAHELRSAKWPTILPSIIDAAERDAEVAELHAKLQAGLSAPYAAVVERARARGEIGPGPAASEIAASVMGPLTYRRWLSREPLEAPFIAGVVARAITSLKGAPKSS